ncbi:MAG: exodeoxyribonuclease III [Candidatus Paceibacterota bacterium]
MKILSWNVNGLRAIVKKDKWNQLFELDSDIFCLQETKAHPDQLPEEIKNPAGYFSFFDHSKVRKGYSGVAIFLKKDLEKEILSVDYGFGKKELDQEGRFLALHLKGFTLINCYFPNGGEDPARLEYKLKFYKEFLNYIEKLKKQNKKIIFCGDVNTAHNEIDLARPKENSNHTGFLRIERDWLDKVTSLGWIDTFRFQYPEKIKYSWWDMKTFARERNVGWRIDYFFVSSNLKEKIKKAEILNDVFGSDHCPVLLELAK